MKKALILPFLFSVLLSFGQNILIEPDGITPNKANGFETKSYEEIMAIPDPKKGEVYFDETFSQVRVFDGVNWKYLTEGSDLSSPSFKEINTGGRFTNIRSRTDSTIICTIENEGVVNLGEIQISSSPNNFIIGEFDFVNEEWLWYETMYLGSAAGINSIDVKGDTMAIALRVFEDISFGSTNVLTSTDGLAKAVVALYDLQSKSWLWVKNLGNNYLDFRKVFFDYEFNIYVVGSFYETIYSDAFSAVNTYNSSRGGVHFQKISKTGVTQSLTPIFSNVLSNYFQYALDDSGSDRGGLNFRILLAVSFEGQINVGPQVYYASSGGGSDLLIYDLLQSSQWNTAKVLGGSGNVRVFDLSVANEHSHVFTIAGSFDGEINFGQNFINLQQTIRNASDDNDGFSASYSFDLVGNIALSDEPVYSVHNYVLFYPNTSYAIGLYSFEGLTLTQKGPGFNKKQNYPDVGSDFVLSDRYVVFRNQSLYKQIR
ncbi:hypothetical protein [Jiulongibacter sediminis]|uniref:Uncharacterized protein n=1 Tax=Jiulongibacter sediminis TaxID=1605367 RepID=A0A0P7BUT0_9BACT|nr:hypothetical protein [Jiulongibacter sediminis]KPM48445.1 hypothetical protein AFM12_07360 [Jiulongibacter sediminis]TBX24983.1 hypothetical protein TK44_07365 [Jiulongibacter sediminis]